MNILITLIFLFTPTLVIGALVVIEEMRKKQIEYALKKSLYQLIKEKNLLITDVEFFNRRAIALDRKDNKIAFVDHSKDTIAKFCFDLENLAFCRINEIKDPSSKYMKRILIELKPKNSDEIFRLPFYDRSTDITYATLSLKRKAEYWKNKINLHKRSGRKVNPQLEYVL